jgi:hypothetical protein
MNFALGFLAGAGLLFVSTMVMLWINDRRGR